MDEEEALSSSSTAADGRASEEPRVSSSISSADYLNRLLREEFPHHREALLRCMKCVDSKASFVVFHVDLSFRPYDRMYHLYCTNCPENWFVCKDCAGQRTHYMNVNEARRHIRDKKHLQINLIDNECIQPSEHSQLISNNDSSSTAGSELGDDALFPFCSLTQQQYFIHNPSILSGDTSEGLRFLVANAMHRKIASECMSELTVDHVMFHTNAAYLSSRLTPLEKACLYRQYYYLTKLFQANYPIDEYLVPTNLNVLNQRYLKGKYSLMQNIPKPSVTSMGRHAYVSLKACIADLLARHDFEIEYLNSYDGDSVQSIFHCSKAQSLVQNISSANGLIDPEQPRLILYIIEWSDDFDPAKCIKDNRGSAWIKTITISAGYNNKEFRNTYPIAIGRKMDSHEVVEKAFADELIELRSGNLQFRLGKFGALVYVYGDIIASLQDQIERRSMNYIMLGGSTFSARWRLSCNFVDLSSKIPSCSKCWTCLLNGDDTSITCEVCLNWDTLGAPFKKPKFYPSDITTPDIASLKSKEITYESLTEAVNKAIDGMSRQRNRWTKQVASCFLSTEGVNSEMIDLISDHVKRLRRAIASNTREPIWNNPSLWNRGVPLSTHIDAPMHLIFLGIVKSTISVVNEWIASKGWNIMIESRTNTTLDVISSLNLTWCRSLPQWRGQKSKVLSTTGWVSENYLAMARLFVWYYSEVINKLVKDKSEDCSKITMLLTSMRSMVSRIMTRVVDQRILLDVRRHIKIFLQCFHVFTCAEKKAKEEIRRRKKSKSPAKVESTDFGNGEKSTQMKKRSRASISLQQSGLTELDTEEVLSRDGVETKPSNDVPQWITKYNYMCLLNIPEVMLSFGPVRNYWEGGMFGEKVLQWAKGSWHGFTLNWHMNMLRSIINAFSVKRTVFDVIDGQYGNQIDFDQDDMVDEGNNFDRTSYHVYKTVDHLKALFGRGVPISVILLEDDVIIAVKNNMAVSVHVHCSDYTHSIGHYYFTCSLVNVRSVDLSKLKILSYGLLLPLYTHVIGAATQWTIVNSEWQDIHVDGTFGYPHVINCKYSI